MIALPRPDFFCQKSKPTPSPVFATYWRFAAERQKLFFARVYGRRPASTTDTILSKFRFTNAYRASDRVSQYLIRNVIYNQAWSNDDLFFRILLFKFFNKIATWEVLQSQFGEITWAGYSFEIYDRALTKMMESGKKIYSAAYIMPSGKTAFHFVRKHQNHLKIIEKMMRDKLPDRVAQQPNMQSVFELLKQYPCIGPFTGYQYTIDINYSPLLNFSENDFVEAGPGALDGLSKVFSDFGDYGPSDLIEYMKDVQIDAFSMYAPDFQDLWGRSLHLIDCQNLFCEVDKYCRIAHPDIPGRSSRTRIKQTYKPAANGLDIPWYPPKWGLNDKIQDVLRKQQDRDRAGAL